MSHVTKNNLTPEKYDIVAQLLHWSMAIMLLYLIFFSHFEEISDDLMKEKIQLHAGLGLLIIFLGLFRWYWRKYRPQPLPISYTNKLQEKASSLIHHAFYALFLLSPVIGILLAGFVSYEVSVFGLFEISFWFQSSERKASLVNSLHGFSADLILALLVLHIAAALYHQFIKRNNILYRMTPYKSKS